MAILQNIELIRKPSRFHQLEMLDMLLIEMKSFFPAIRLKVIISKDKDIDTRYLYYIVKCIKFKGTNSSLSSMNSNDVKKYIISIPTITRQKEIAEILDKFDTLIKDISKGIPREIALRKKQYEYYMERLVSGEMVG